MNYMEDYNESKIKELLYSDDNSFRELAVITGVSLYGLEWMVEFINNLMIEDKWFIHTFSLSGFYIGKSFFSNTYGVFKSDVSRLILTEFESNILKEVIEELLIEFLKRSNIKYA